MGTPKLMHFELFFVQKKNDMLDLLQYVYLLH